MLANKTRKRPKTSLMLLATQSLLLGQGGRGIKISDKIVAETAGGPARIFSRVLIEGW